LGHGLAELKFPMPFLPLTRTQPTYSSMKKNLSPTLLISGLYLLFFAPCQAQELLPEFVSLLPPAPGVNGAAGAAVATSDRWVVVGEPSRQVGAVLNAGAVHVYSRSTGKLVRTLTPRDPVASGAFGSSVALSGNTVMVGATGQSTVWGNTGAVYLFALPSGRQTRKLEPSGPTEGFGRAVALDGFRAAVGVAKFASGGGSSVQFYDLNKRPEPFLNGFSVQPADAANSRLGTSLAILGRMVLAGDPGLRRAFLFSFDTQLPMATLQPVGGTGEDFGRSVALSGGMLAVGAPGEIWGAETRGAVYVYHLNNLGSPVRLVHPGPQVGDEFGRAVGATEDRVFIGVPGLGKNEVRVVTFNRSDNVLTPLLTNVFNKQNATGTSLPATRFGTALAVHNGYMVIGDSLFGTGGAAFFDRPNGIGEPRYGPPGFGVGVAGTVNAVDGHPGASLPQYRKMGPVRLNQDNLSFASTLSGVGTAGGRTTAVVFGLPPSYVTGGADALPGDPLTSIRQVRDPVLNGVGHDDLYCQVTLRQPSGQAAVLRKRGMTQQVAVRTGDELSAILAGGKVRRIQRALMPRYERFLGVHIKGQLGTGDVTRTSDSAVIFFGGASSAANFERVSFREGGSIGEISSRFVYSEDDAFVTHAILGTPGQRQAITAMTPKESSLLFGTSELTKTGLRPFNSVSGPIQQTLFGATSNANFAFYRTTFQRQAGLVTTRNNEAIYGASKSNFNVEGLSLTKGEEIVDSGGLFVSRLLKFWPVSNGIVAQVRLGGPGVSSRNDLALIWRAAGLGGTYILLREGDGIGSADGASINVIQRVEVAPKSTTVGSRDGVIALASLRGSNAARNQVLLTTKLIPDSADSRRRSAQLLPIARKGVTPGVRGFSFAESVNEAGVGFTGTGGVVNDLGQSAVIIISGSRQTLRYLPSTF